MFMPGNECLCCGKKCGMLILCEKCLKSFMNYDSFLHGRKRRCTGCGRRLLSETSLCSKCTADRVVVSAERVYPLHDYALWKKDVLFAWKTDEVRVMSPFFAKMISDAVRELEVVSGMAMPVVPVPPRPGKIRKTGWDQIEELCYYLHRMYGISVRNLLVRYSKTQQKKMDRARRFCIIENGYGEVSSRKREKLYGKTPDSVILLDDVMTTGATAEACSKILRNMGMKRIFVVTLFAV